MTWWFGTNRNLLLLFNQILANERTLMTQFDDLSAAVAAANTALAALQARDATVAAGVAALQQEVQTLEAQIASGTAPDLSGVTAQVNALATALAPIDTEDTSIPQPPAAA